MGIEVFVRGLPGESGSWILTPRLYITARVVETIWKPVGRRELNQLGGSRVEIDVPPPRE